jgi:hypothetical protein
MEPQHRGSGSDVRSSAASAAWQRFLDPNRERRLKPRRCPFGRDRIGGDVNDRISPPAA